ncbi:MAG: O-antigen ligase family protein [Proteobacteria bacterium]|nr:O-antigen ligase family protein [Pseudomonadota bacterium]
MSRQFDLGAVARTLMFVLLPWLCTVAILGVAAFVSVAGALSVRLSRVRQALEKRSLALLLLLAFAAWAAVSSLWSNYPDHIQALKLWLTLLGGLLFADAASKTQKDRKLTNSTGTASFVVLAILLGIEALWSRPFNHALHPTLDIGTLDKTTGRATSVLIGMTWASAAGCVGWGPSRLRVMGMVALLALGGALSLQFNQIANAVAFGIGLIAFALALIAPRLAIMGASGGLASWVLAAPFVTPLLFTDQRVVDALPMSGAARVVIWRYVSGRIPEKFWFGHGLDASRTAPQMLPVRADYSVAAIPLHPHSASMQIWFELGAVGALLAAAALLVGGWSLAQRSRGDRFSAAAAAATIASLGVIANLSYGIWQEWWDATMLLAAALVASAAPRAASS